MTGESTARRAGAPAGLDLRGIESVPGYALRRAQLLEAKLFAATVGRDGVRPVQFTLLVLVRDNPGVRAVDLARALDIRRANMVSLVQELEDVGWLERRPHPLDGRAQSLQLTATGRRELAALDRRHQQLQRRWRERLDEEDLAQLVRLLQRFAGNARD